MNCFLYNLQIAFEEVKSFSAVCMHDFKRAGFCAKFATFWRQVFSLLMHFGAFWLRYKLDWVKLTDGPVARCDAAAKDESCWWEAIKLKWTESNWSKEHLLMSIHSWSPSLSFLKEQLVNCDRSSCPSQVSFEMYLSTFWNVFVYILECICLNSKMYLLITFIVFSERAACELWPIVLRWRLINFESRFWQW